LHPRVGVENLAVFEVSVLIELDTFVVFFCFCGLGLIGCLWIKVLCLKNSLSFELHTFIQLQVSPVDLAHR
jgi:hypothetical protein